jgi:hypothetical protein
MFHGLPQVMQDTGYRRNPKSQALNPKQIEKFKAQMFKTLLAVCPL